MFGLQLTETPVASGAKAARGPDLPTPVPGAVKPEFHTYLGQAQSGQTVLNGPVPNGPVSNEPVLNGSVSDVPVEGGETAALASDLPSGHLPIERLSKLSDAAGLSDTTSAAPAQMMGKAPLADPDRSATQLSVPGTEDVATPDAVSQPDMSPVQVSQTAKNMNQETVTAQTLSPETEADADVEASSLSQADIPEEGILPQPDSGIRPEVDPSLRQEASSSQIIAQETLDALEEIASPETLEQPAASLDLPTDTDVPVTSLMASGLADAGLTASDRSAVSARSLMPDAAPISETEMSSRAQTASQLEGAARLQTTSQPDANEAFSRVLTDVSVSVAPSAAPVQAAQPTPQTAVTQQAQPMPTLDMSQANWAEKLVEDVSLQPLGRGDTLTLTLTPERLGTMQVRLEMQDGQTHVHFVTETPEAARLLNDAQPRLADLMSRAGVDLGAQSATTGQGSQQNDRSGQPATVQDMSPDQPAESIEEASSSELRSAGASSRSTVDVVA